MEIFYTKYGLSGVPKKHVEERKIGRKFLFYILEKKYSIKNAEIEIINNKPRLKIKGPNFSISHSKGLLAIGFNENEIGLDIEFMKDIDLKRFSNRYKKKFSTNEDFYKFWTEYEAEIKLQAAPKYRYNTVFNDNYYLSVLSEKELEPVCITAINNIHPCFLKAYL